MFQWCRYLALWVLVLSPTGLMSAPTLAAPRAEVILAAPSDGSADIPEEILRQELILDGRSRLDGQPLSPEAYAQQEDQLGQSGHPPRISAELQSLVFQLKLLHLLRSLVPGL